MATLFEAKTHLSALVKQVEETGEEIVITRHGKPVVVLAPYRPPQVDRQRTLAGLRLRASEEGIAYNAEQLTAPLPASFWGDWNDEGSSEGADAE